MSIAKLEILHMCSDDDDGFLYTTCTAIQQGKLLYVTYWTFPTHDIFIVSENTIVVIWNIVWKIKDLDLISNWDSLRHGVVIWCKWTTKDRSCSQDQWYWDNSEQTAAEGNHESKKRKQFFFSRSWKSFHLIPKLFWEREMTVTMLPSK